MRTTKISAVRRGLLTMAALAGLAATTAQAQTTLRWKFEKGETLNYSMNQKTSIKITANNASLENTMTQVIDTTWVVKDVADGVAELGQTIDRIRTTMELPNAKFEYDSKDGKIPEGPAGQALGPLLSALAGAEITFRMNGRGEVSDVRMPEKLLAAVRNAPNAAQAGGMFTEDGLKKMITQSTLTLPEEPISPGSSWSKRVELPSPGAGTLTLDNKYTYEGPKDQEGKKLERIAVAIQIGFEPKEDAPLKLRVKSQDSRGAFLFDNAKGRLDESGVEQKMELIASVSGMEITQAHDTTATMKLGRPAGD